MRTPLAPLAALALALVACGGKTDDNLGQTGVGAGGSSAGGSSAGGSSAGGGVGKGGSTAGGPSAGGGVGKGGSAGQSTGLGGFGGDISSTGGTGGSPQSCTEGAACTVPGDACGYGADCCSTTCTCDGKDFKLHCVTTCTPEGGGGNCGVGGTGGGGTGGSGPGCCTSDMGCGDFAFMPCVNGVCKTPAPAGACWRDADCGPSSFCKGAYVCPCGANCGGMDTQGTCTSTTGDWKACGKPGDCELESKGCCDACGKPQVTDLDAVDFQKVQDHFAQVCPNPGGCPACAAQPNPNLAAFCRANACGVVEISNDEVSLCTSDKDCDMHLAQCCDCGTGQPDQYIALNVSQIGAYEAQVCGPGVGGCQLDCAPQHPAGIAATCDVTTGHCQMGKTNVAKSCPPTAPTGGACALPSGTTCEYGQSPVTQCREHVICSNGQWSFPPSACPVISPAGQNGCLKDPSQAGQACANNGQVCDMGGGAICECGACFGGPCMSNMIWGCSGSPGASCPALAPDTGQPCGPETEGISCMYGVPCSFTMAYRVCQGGVWVDQPIACGG